MANKVDLAHLQAIADAMAGGTNQAVSDDEEMNQYEQTMDYREMMKEQANQAIDEDFGDMLVIPIPEEENDDGWCGTECCYPCKVFWYRQYRIDFENSRITIEDQGRILRNPLLFRKDGKLTMQPRKVSYDLDGNAEIDKSDPEHACIMRLQGQGIELKKVDLITGKEILECFIEYKKDTKTLHIDNIRSHLQQKTQLVGAYDVAPDREQKNKDLLGITV